LKTVVGSEDAAQLFDNSAGQEIIVNSCGKMLQSLFVARKCLENVKDDFFGRK